MLRIARAFALSLLLAFTGALFMAASRPTPSVTCNIELMIDNWGAWHWQCYGNCPDKDGETQTCELTTFPWGEGFVTYCWCPASTHVAPCPGGIYDRPDGLLIPICLFDRAPCAPGHVCKVNDTYWSQFFVDICRCQPE